MNVHGACHCGSVAFEAVVDPARVLICHCNACQVLTGTAYRVTVPAAAAEFRLLRGEPRVYVKVADSGNRRAMAFCASCGSSLYSHAATESPQSYGLRVGCLAERASLVPRKRIWCQTALGWSMDLRDIPGVERE